jgi:MYXO-CTERM domain-containing protein
VLGTVSPDNGDFSSLFDIKLASTFVSCAGEDPTAGRCETQLLKGFCGFTHYPCAPLCFDYGVRDNNGALEADSCSDAGVSQQTPEAGMPSQDAGVIGKKPSSSSCACSAPGSASGAPGLLAFALLGLVLRLGVGRRRAS